MSFKHEILRKYIIDKFLDEQISIENNSKNVSELDSFTEMHVIENSITEEKPEQKNDYKYLDNDILSKEFCLDREHDILEMKRYMISLCFFNINEELKTPFLEFLFDNQTGEFSFPKKELQMDVLANLYKKENEMKINIENTTPFQKMNSLTSEDYDDETEIETMCDEVEMEFFEQCSKFAQEIVFLTDDVLKQRYLGFIEKDDIFYVVFDVTNITILENIHNNNKNGYFFGIIDEIINRKKIFETPIDQKILDMFESSPLLKNIYDYNNKEVNVPKLVYLCVDENFDNEHESNSENNNNTVIEEKPIIIETNNNYLHEKSDIVQTKSPFVENKLETKVETKENEVSDTTEVIENKPIKQDNELEVSDTIEALENKPIKQKGGSTYKNLYYETDDTVKSQSPILSVINPKINHPLFDNVYLFTSEPFIKSSQKGLTQEILSSVVNNTTATDEINKMKRYALEIDSVKYYKDVDVETLIEKNEIISPNYDVYCFYEDNREYWAVKSNNNFTEI
uniref:Uncharacterized protein n=1 Tax=viral metagenome TaxID=1070528 RepID=A0A6C0DBK1_9ZZZZ